MRTQTEITLERPSVRDITRAPTGGIRGSGTLTRKAISYESYDTNELKLTLTTQKKIHLKKCTTSPATTYKIGRVNI